jgi:hypothetical protein
MSRSIDNAVLLAAEATLAHLVMMTKMAGAKLISEGALYETFNIALRTHTKSWVNHEHKVVIDQSVSAQKTRAGDKPRVDFAVEMNGKVALVELKIASRTKLRQTVNVSRDMVKLVQSEPLLTSSKPFMRHAYLVVFNVSTCDTSKSHVGKIMWNDPPPESDISVIGVFNYASGRFKRTAVVYRIWRNKHR